MDLQPEVSVQCPYCWETISLLLDASAGAQNYVEDCSVCCRPIIVHVSFLFDEPEVWVEPEMD
ncbi:MAG TPA: CPXCG motif-containing cysteine-rich protein [Halothiobacillus sp.]|nr:CPXCG motif-containing cysteine-rich protein [Halothiobacillus sp.]